MPRARSATRSASSAVVGERDPHSDGLGGRSLPLPDHQLAGMGERLPVDVAPVVARPVGAGASGLAEIGRHPLAASPVWSCGRTASGTARPRRGAT